MSTTSVHAHPSYPRAGPGPATMANKKTAAERARSYCDHPSATCDPTFRPVSILRKPSLPNLNNLAEVAAAAVPRVPATAPTTSSPLSGYTMDCSRTSRFPPLPPLPPFHHSASNNVLRKSAPPATYTSPLTASGSQTVRIRPRTSRVSFREEVEALDDKTPRRRPTSHGPPSPLPSQPRRPSADADTAVRRATSVKPVLKRASSSVEQQMRRASSASTRYGSATKALAMDDPFDACRSQTLRYPRVSPALARLSDPSLGAATEIWTASIPRSKQGKQATIEATTSKLTSSPVTMHSSDTSSKGGASERDNRASGQATPARKSRKPRSPIPSWSSTCPSLSSSSHRASVASTLTAPSMTSLLLSPPSPIDRYLPAMPTGHAFGEDGVPGSPLPLKARDGDDEENDVPALDGGFSGKRNSSGSVYQQRDMGGGQGHSSNPRERIRPRHSEPSFAPSSFSSHTYSVPRASERLLRLQNSLADLRKQRRASEKLDEPSSMHRSKQGAPKRDSSRAGSAPPSAPGVPSNTSRSARLSPPPSPTVGELARSCRLGLGRESEDTECDDSGDESDLDLSLPPLNAALRSRVIPSSSRLLMKMTQPKGTGHDAERDDDGLGWSGSESEEEEFSRTVARIARRKSAMPRELAKRPSLPAGYLHRHSDFSGFYQAGNGGSQTSPSSSGGSISGGPPTPSVADRPSTSLGTSHPNGTAALLSALVEQKYASRDQLPRPKRFVQGWGAPEVLLEDDWPPDALAGHDDHDLHDEFMSEESSATTPIAKQAEPASTLLPSLPRPLGAAW